MCPSDKIIEAYVSHVYEEKLGNLQEYFKVDNKTVTDEKFAQKLGAEIYGHVQDHLSVLESVFGKEIRQESLVSGKY